VSTRRALGIDHHTTPMSCPACGYRVDAATSIDREADPNQNLPVDGNLAVCLACASVNVYINGATTLRLPTVDERAEFMTDPGVVGSVRAVLNAKDQHARTWPIGPFFRPDTGR
jgi:hypothetical protein